MEELMVETRTMPKVLWEVVLGSNGRRKNSRAH